MRVALKLFVGIICSIMYVLGNEQNLEQRWKEDIIETKQKSNQSNARESLNKDETKDQWRVKDTKSYMALYPHKAVYILPYYYSFSHPALGNLREETKFQFSFKLLVGREFFSPYGRLYFGYTQTSWFQNYNKEDSQPFRDVDYQPEIFYSYERGIKFLGGEFASISFGLVHTSNGERALRSRTQNRLLLDVKWEYALGRGVMGLQMDAWVYVGTNFPGFIHDNKDLSKFRGYNDLRLYYKDSRHLVEAYIRPGIALAYYPFFELGYTLRITRNMGLYVQYVNGYGDNMYEYNLKSQRLGIGLSLWNDSIIRN